MTTLTLASRWNPLDWPLTHGPIPQAVQAVGWAALILLALRRDRSWWRFGLPAALATAAGLSLLLGYLVDDWWHPFPEGTPRYVTWWVATALLGLCLAAYRMRRSTWPRRVLGLGLGSLVLLMAASEVNIGFDMYPNGRVMLAPWLDRTAMLSTTKSAETATAPPDKVLEEVWTPPPGLPAKGTVSQAHIPGTKSGFHGRNAYIYLPPAYQASPRPLLPVLVLITGQPGAPDEWVHQGQVDELMDAFAAKHGGLAPIVVMPDQLGATWNNSLCMDSKIAKMQTYLAEDVPNWAQKNLQTATGRRSWAIGGASMGGTCALQLGVNAPEVYGTVLDISGQEEPTLGTRAETVKAAFGGDTAKFDAIDPLQVMARRQFPDTAIAVVVGEGDGIFRPQQEKVYKAVQGAGMKATFATAPGGHGWMVFRPAIADQLPWLARQTGLIR
ncbi:alpha/beta hydrolase [Streptomyces sp. NRRL WC-3742]|uniref:alpha/beta hydrolase n=1 Tax=Streptomyces sp. NRRL WC-3742 TaxID=1463934 RepID=UPI00068C09F0|nr:alpha/beta hydrolase-fold protein [Streptomyces sp. NRRL WC-3742]